MSMKDIQYDHQNDVIVGSIDGLISVMLYWQEM